jgi:hypothetical protein
MTLSLESIYQPLTDFFSNLFRTDAGSPVLFRFDKFGSVVSDQDFIDPIHPELGYLPALVREKFSDLVNHIPVDLGDGMNIFLSPDLIDDTYFFRLLSPSIPYIPDGIDDATKQAIISAFSLIKADALKIWNNLTLESITGLMLQYKPSVATPQDWYDRTKNDVWTNHSFQINEKSSTSTSSPSTQLWKLKLSDESMRNVLQLPVVVDKSVEQPPINIPDHVLKLRETLIPKVTSVGEERTPLAVEALSNQLVFTPAVSHNISIAAEGNLRANVRVTPVDNVRVTPVDNVALYDTFLRQNTTLDVSKKLLVNQYIGINTPTQSVTTDNISISFDYCLVKVERQWWKSIFSNATSWCIPTVSKGQVTSSGPAGNLPLMPIGFVAIRNLVIEANWTAEDVTNASSATDFGPFKVNANIVNNKLTHEGLQTFAWVLQKMSDLPPNDVPSPNSEVSSTLCTVTVDALHIRVQPNSQSTIVATKPRGTMLDFSEVVNGENVDGNLHWGHSKQGNYFWLGGTDHPNG